MLLPLDGMVCPRSPKSEEEVESEAGYYKALYKMHKHKIGNSES